MERLARFGVLFVLFMFLGCRMEDGVDSLEVVVHLTEAMTVEDVVAISNSYSISPIELRYEFDDISGGYVVPDGESMESAVKNMTRRHEEFLDNALDNIDTHLRTAVDEEDIRMHEELRTKFVNLSQSGLRINSLKLDSDSVTINRLRSDGIIDSVREVSDDYSVELDAPEVDNGVRPCSYYHESWAPYYGTSKVTQGQTFQTFYFNDVSAFDSVSTYEHETQVYDKNFADYDNYWSSNLPSAYYDTPFSDSIDNFTVGSAQASSLSTYTQYYTYMSLRAGSSSSATVRIKGQKGHRYPSWCYSTWCIFADATTSSLITFTAPVYTNLEWTY